MKLNPSFVPNSFKTGPVFSKFLPVTAPRNSSAKSLEGSHRPSFHSSVTLSRQAEILPNIELKSKKSEPEVFAPNTSATPVQGHTQGSSFATQFGVATTSANGTLMMADCVVMDHSERSRENSRWSISLPSRSPQEVAVEMVKNRWKSPEHAASMAKMLDIIKQ